MLLENYPIVRQSLEVVGLSVFHTLWAGCLLLLLLIVVLKVIPPQLAKVRFAVALTALQLLFLLFLGTVLYHWQQVSPASASVDRTIATPALTLPAEPPSVLPAAEVNAAPTEVPWLTRLHPWARWWAALWLLGAAYHAIRLLLGVRHTRQLRVNAQPVSGDWEKRFDHLKQCLGIKQPVIFSQSDQTTVPLTFGWLKPVVLIPASLLTQLSPEQIEMIVLHELAHIRRHDYLWSLGQSVAEVVLFYHPAYWYIARVLEREREFACDQMTVSLTQQPQAYARTLLQVATATTPNYGLAASGKRGLSDRIRRIVNPARRQRSGPVLPALMLVGVLGVASVAFAMQRQQFGSGDSPEAQAQPVDSTDIDYGPTFEEVMAQVSDETLDTTSLTLDELYERALTIDQSLNQFARSLQEYIASHPEAYKNRPADSPINYSSAEVLYVVDGQVRDPKSVRQGDVEETSVYHELEELKLEGIDLRGYSTVVVASTAAGTHQPDSSHSGRHLYLNNGWGQFAPPVTSNSPNAASPTDRWLYIVNDQVQTNRPAFLDQYYQTAGWETRYVPVAGSWINDYLTKEQQALVDVYRHTGILFITHQDYQPKHVVYGTVVKREKGYLVPDVTVRVKGKDISTTTNAYGDYRLVIPHRLDTIEFLFNEGVIEEVPVDGRREINLTTPVDRALIKEMKTKKMQEMLRRTEQKLQANNEHDSILLTGQAYNWFTNQYIPDVQVVANDSATTVTDADGQYQFRFPSGTKDVSLAFSAPGYPTRNMPVDMTGKKYFHAVMSMVREDENAVIEALQTQPAQDSATTNTLIIIDGEPQYDKSWNEIDQELKENPLFSHHTLTSHGADSSQAILKALRAEKYDRVVSIDSWANLKKGGQIAPSKLEELLQVFPNPTQDWFTLQFFIGEELPITITILNNQGQPLTTLTDQTYPAGAHEVAWDASDQKPGVYFVRWTVGEQRVTRKVMIE